MKPTVSPQLLKIVLVGIGGALLTLAHSGLLGGIWGQLIGELGAGLALVAKSAPGDIGLHELPAEVQESVRPPKDA